MHLLLRGHDGAGDASHAFVNEDQVAACDVASPATDADAALDDLAAGDEAVLSACDDVESYRFHASGVCATPASPEVIERLRRPGVR